MEIPRNEQEELDITQPQECSAVPCQPAAISVPVTVRPIARAGEVNTFCCGEPKVTQTSNSVRYNNNRNMGGGCSFVITQNICIEIPIDFSAQVFTDTPQIDCGVPYLQKGH